MGKDQNDFKKIKAKLWDLCVNQHNQKKIKAIETIIDTPSDKFIGLIDPSQAINENIPEIDEQEEKKIVVVFKNYNQDECELSKLDEPLAKALTSKLKYLTSITLKQLPSSGLIRGDVDESGPYKVLYNNIGQDVRVKEIKFSNESRIFGFLVDEYFSLIAIWVNHVNLH